MSGGGPRKEQQKLFAFLGGASTGVGDGGSAQRTIGPRARREMEDAVTSLANKYFAGLFQVQDTKKVGAPSKDRIERERAVGVLSKAFCGWHFASTTKRANKAQPQSNPSTDLPWFGRLYYQKQKLFKTRNSLISISPSH